ncbi:HD domain-containing protein [Streptococcus cameli]
MKLKDTTRRCYMRKGRHESVAEHSWMMILMAFFLTEEISDLDMNNVIQMCLIHDLGEAFIGDIPTFDKNEEDEKLEENHLQAWLSQLPNSLRRKMQDLYAEMNQRETAEAKLYKALDGLEALIQHNISDLSTWIPNEFELNLTYAHDKVAFSPYLQSLREEIRKDIVEKILTETLAIL